MNSVKTMLLTLTVILSVPSSVYASFIETDLSRSSAVSDGVNISLDPFNILTVAAAFVSAGFPAPSVLYTEDTEHFDLSITSGGGLDSDEDLTMSFDTNLWRGNLTFNPENNFTGSDTFTVNGNLLHTSRPDDHNDPPTGLPITFGPRTVLDTDTVESQSVSRPHGLGNNHFDKVFMKLEASVVDGNILGWVFTLSAIHVSPPEEVRPDISTTGPGPETKVFPGDVLEDPFLRVPAPSSIAALAIGVGIVFRRCRTANI